MTPKSKKPVACCSCELETKKLTQVVKPPYDEHWHCDLCATTLIGHACIWPEIHSYKGVTPEMLAQTAHWLLKKLKKS